MPPRSEALVEQARQYDERARHHKREAARHRRASRECRRKQSIIEAECARLGIDITYINGEGRTSHGRPGTRTFHAY